MSCHRCGYETEVPKKVRRGFHLFMKRRRSENSGDTLIRFFVNCLIGSVFFYGLFVVLCLAAVALLFVLDRAFGIFQ